MRKLFLTLLSLVGIFCVNAQNLVKIGNEQVSTDEFLKAYSKNNRIDTATEASLREYLDLFINFKMKVMEGMELQLDTAKRFSMELASYQRQSSQQFLVDKEVTDALINEAKQRAMQNIRASHILINCSENASDKDTAAAYQKALNIRKEILSKSITFADAAVKYSQDPSARDMVNPQTNRLHIGNKGDLGYFTVFDLIYPFENAAYNTPVGEISMPVRTKFGYHLVYVVDKVSALENVTIAQIFVADSLAKDGQQLETTARKLTEAQMALKNGIAFEEAVKKYSEDAANIENGGVQEPFALNSRQGDFVKAVITLKQGEISQPIASQNGWHIVKLIDTKPVVVDEDMEYNIKNRISRDTRSHKSREAFISRLKKEYKYEESGREKAMKFFVKNMPAEFFQTKEANLAALPGFDKLKPMASFANEQVTPADFAKYISRFRGLNLDRNEALPFLQERFDMFVSDKMIRYENSQLMDKYPELKELVQEFHDGMVLYEINTTKVWAAAVQDTTGLEEFYTANQSKYIDPKTQEPSELNSIRAIVITDYQEYLDKKWIAELREKYKPVVDEKVFQTILKK